MGAKDRLRTYFLSHVGEVLSSDTLRDVGATAEWARRIRELRGQEGYDIQTHNDRADLRPGEYVLVSATPSPVESGVISKEARAYVLDRDGFTCQNCGAVAGEIHEYDGRKIRLHVGHIIDRSKGGSDDPANLRALCSVCNEGAANLTLDPPRYVTLLTQVRRATLDDQRKVLEWLLSKFGRTGEETR